MGRSFFIGVPPLAGSIVAIPKVAAASWEIGEVPSGAINGSNATFTSAYDFIPGKVQVYSNGVRLKITDDFSTSGTRTIQLNFSPATGEKITIDYQR